MSGEGLVVLIPVLGRPHRVRPVLDSLAETTAGARVLFVTDPDDVEEERAIHDAAEHFDQGMVARMIHGGNYAEKINAAVKVTDEPLIFLGADDLKFHPGWFWQTTRLFLQQPLLGVIGTNDLCNLRVMRGQHSTHCLVTRSYAEQGTIDEPGKLLHEGYQHEFVDDEFVETAKSRDAWAFAGKAIVEHLHPDAGKAPMDDLYAARPARMRFGRGLFRQRAHLWAST